MPVAVRNKNKNKIPLFANIAVACLGIVVSSCLFAEEIAVTQAKSSYTQLSLSSIRAVFSMRLSTWPDGSPIKVFVLPDRHPEHARFARGVLNMFPYQLRREWDRQVYSGTGVAPIEVPDVETMKRRIAQTPGAIGYLDEEAVDSSIQAIHVE